MVKKIGQLLLNGGGGGERGGCHPPAPSLWLILEPRWWVRFEKVFHGQMPQAKKALPNSEKNWKNLLEGGGGGGPSEG